MHKTSLFIFRRDLRLHDNTALLKAIESSEQVYLAFCFDHRQIDEHAYRSLPALQFMLESLQELSEEIEKHDGQLYILDGEAEEEIPHFVKTIKADAVYINADYTPFARKRDDALKKILDKAGVALHIAHDALLTEPGSVLKGDGSPYTVYTPFAKRARALHVSRPVPLPRGTAFAKAAKSKRTLKTYIEKFAKKGAVRPAVEGGRSMALAILKDIKEFAQYKTERDIPELHATTYLSAHHKFGTISIRETYWTVVEAFSRGHGLISELYWRDFFTHIAWHFPHVFEGAFRKEYNALEWNRSKKDFVAWCEGKTGYPIVDAGMRELNETGYMHNRVRMITASFLVKNLHIDWRWGERYFAQHLVDYDPAVNNGNWQWAASTGCDAQPYFRIFNPWLQQKKFDEDARYIKTWIPELQEATAKQIHGLEKAEASIGTYPLPMVHHKTAREETLKRYKKIK